MNGNFFPVKDFYNWPSKNVLWEFYHTQQLTFKSMKFHKNTFWVLK